MRAAGRYPCFLNSRTLVAPWRLDSFWPSFPMTMGRWQRAGCCHPNAS